MNKCCCLACSSGRRGSARLGSLSGSPTDWKGTRILYGATGPQTGWDLWLLDLVARKPVAYPAGTIRSDPGHLLPGRPLHRLYVQTFPASDQKWKISVNGGVEPRWSADGTQLFFLSEDLALMSASVLTVPTFKPGEPQRLFQTQVPEGGSPYRRRYEVSKDGKRFLVFTQTNRSAPTAITAVLNWTTGLKR